jgi:hypothetical protein
VLFGAAAIDVGLNGEDRIDQVHRLGREWRLALTG